MKKTLAFTGSLALFLSVAAFPAGAWTAPNGSQTTAGESGSIVVSDVPSYREFLQTHQDTLRPSEPVMVDLNVFTGEGATLENDAAGWKGESLTTEETGYVEFSVDVPQAGLYAIHMEFISGYSRGATVERKLLINGAAPHTEAESLVFGRLYQDAEDERNQTDAAGNEIRPSQKEVGYWQESYLRDRNGSYNEPLMFYFEQGTNFLRLISVAEPLTIGSVTLKNPEALPSYEEVRQEYDEKGYSFTGLGAQKIQGESAVLKSSPMLYPNVDRTSPATDPPSLELQKLNTIGGSRWQTPGQFLVWEFDVEESGLYTFYIKERQNISRGVTSNRTVYIDGEIPFKEFETVSFAYSDKWAMTPLGDGKTACAVYLEKGTHQLRMDVTLGEMAEPIDRVQTALTELNALYTQFMIITGSNPDPMRDYMLDELVPDEIARLGELAEELQEVSDWFVDYTGGKGNLVSTLNTAIRQLKKMSADGNIIPKNMGYFKSNIGSLGDWMNTVREQPLDIDYIVLASEEDPTFEKINANFFEQFSYEFQLFLRSFIDDYSSMGSVYEEGEQQKTIQVWMYSGRDQAQILRKLIDQNFTPKTSIGVQLQLVDGSVLLPATVAGIGPDVTLGMGDEEPVNYAIRNAVVDLTQFPDFEEVAARFLPERLVPLSFDGKTYALPETQDFDVLFYRKDVLSNLGIEIPQTWEDVVSIIPRLQKSNMNFAIPVGAGTYYTMLFQNGGELYTNEGRASALDSEMGLSTFKKWTNFYVNYELPQDFDFLSRFRTGEYPLIINSFLGFNSLQVSAPEVRGLWGFTLLPGVKKEDGTIDRSAAFGGSNCFILNNTDDKASSWKFLKWWTEADTQVQYGNELESVMGESARYNTANVEAFNRIPWSRELYGTLSEQMSWGRGVEQVPGAYFTPRHVLNAFRKVVISKADAKETLYDYVYTINQELTGKRKEFGLPVD